MKAQAVSAPSGNGRRVPDASGFPAWLAHTRRISYRATVLFMKSARIYSQDFLMQLISYPLQMLVVWYVWRAALTTGALRGASPGNTIAYYATVFLLARVVDWGRMTAEAESDIHNGNLMIYLARPLYHWQVLLARTLARAVIGIGYGLPLLLILIGFVLKQPLSLVGVVGFTITGFMSMLMEFTIYYTVSLTGFWVERVWGIMLASQFTISLLGGRLLPINFFPTWFRGAVHYLPFQFIAYEPARTFLGNPSWREVMQLGAWQGFWLTALTCIAVGVWWAGSKRFTGQGA